MVFTKQLSVSMLLLLTWRKATLQYSWLRHLTTSKTRLPVLPPCCPECSAVQCSVVSCCRRAAACINSSVTKQKLETINSEIMKNMIIINNYYNSMREQLCSADSAACNSSLGYLLSKSISHIPQPRPVGILLITTTKPN